MAEDDIVVIGEYIEGLKTELGETSCEQYTGMPDDMDPGMMMDQGMMDAAAGMMDTAMMPPPPTGDISEEE